MPSPLPHRRLAALTIAAVAVLGLTGCTGLVFPDGSSASRSTSPTAAPTAGQTEDSSPTEDEGAAGGQSVAEACAIVRETIDEATTEFENLGTEDPAAAVEAMRAAAQRITDISSQISNAEVAALLPSLEETFQQISEVLEAIAAGDASRLTELENIGTTFQETGERFQELCGA